MLFHCLEKPIISSPLRADLRTPYDLQSPRTLARNVHIVVIPDPCKGESVNINISIFEKKENRLQDFEMVEHVLQARF